MLFFFLLLVLQNGVNAIVIIYAIRDKQPTNPAPQ